MATIKPHLSKEEKRLLKIKNERARRRVEFHRQEWFRYKKLGDSWRKPRGKHSKQREHLKKRPPVVDAGFRSPKAVRGLHPSGFKEVLVSNGKELEAIDPKIQAARLSATLGGRKKEELLERADELGVRVINRGVKE